MSRYNKEQNNPPVNIRDEYDSYLKFKRDDKYYDLLYITAGRINQALIEGNILSGLYMLSGMYDLVGYRIGSRLTPEIFDTKMSGVLSSLQNQEKNQAGKQVNELRRVLFFEIGYAGLFPSEEKKPDTSMSIGLRKFVEKYINTDDKHEERREEI